METHLPSRMPNRMSSDPSAAFSMQRIKKLCTQVVFDKYLVEKRTPLSIRAGVTHDDTLPAPAEHSSHSIALSGLNDSPQGHQ